MHCTSDILRSYNSLLISLSTSFCSCSSDFSPSSITVHVINWNSVSTTYRHVRVPTHQQLDRLAIPPLSFLSYIQAIHGCHSNQVDPPIHHNPCSCKRGHTKTDLVRLIIGTHAWIAVTLILLMILAVVKSADSACDQSYIWHTFFCGSLWRSRWWWRRRLEGETGDGCMWMVNGELHAIHAGSLNTREWRPWKNWLW